MKRVSEKVFRKNSSLFFLRKEILENLEEEVSKSKDRLRVNLHSSNEDLCHEMLIVMHKESKVKIHRHKGKHETYLVLKGLVDVVFVDDDGITDVERVRIGSIEEVERGNADNFMYRLDSERFHYHRVISEMAVIMEITDGPFTGD